MNSTGIDHHTARRRPISDAETPASKPNRARTTNKDPTQYSKRPVPPEAATHKAQQHDENTTSPCRAGDTHTAHKLEPYNARDISSPAIMHTIFSYETSHIIYHHVLEQTELHARIRHLKWKGTTPGWKKASSRCQYGPPWMAPARATPGSLMTFCGIDTQTHKDYAYNNCKHN